MSQYRPDMSLRLVLFVKDPQRSLHFYRHILDFHIAERMERYVAICRGSAVLGLVDQSILPEDYYFSQKHLKQRKGIGIELVLEVDNIESLYDHVQAEDCTIESPLRRRPWGLSDFRITDPDGYYIRITSRE